MNDPERPKTISIDLQFWDNADYVAQAPSLEKLLSEEERARRDRQVNQEKALFWSISRARIRQFLSAATGVAPDTLIFDVSPYGQLSLRASKDRSIAFSISHSGSLSVLAISRSGLVGVDIEAVKDLSIDEMMWPLSPAEQTDLLSVAPSDVAQAFFRYWTLKEAFIKALGLGVSFPLDDFDISPFGAPPALLRVAEEPEAPAEWAFRAGEIIPRVRYAIAVKSTGARINFRQGGTIG